MATKKKTPVKKAAPKKNRAKPATTTDLLGRRERVKAQEKAQEVSTALTAQRAAPEPELMPTADVKLQKEGNDLRTFSGAVLAHVTQLQVVDGKTYGLAAHILAEVKGRINYYEEKRLGVGRKLREAIAAVDELFSGVKQLKQAESAIKDKLATYFRNAPFLQGEALAKAQAARAANDTKALSAAITEAVDMEIGKVPGLSVTPTWTYEIVDANLLPREYLCPDEKKIAAVVKAAKGSIEIAGVRAVPEYQISSASTEYKPEAA